MTIKVPLRRREKTLSNIVRVTDAAREILQDIVDDHNVSATQVVSALIIQGHKYLEFVDPKEDDLD